MDSIDFGLVLNLHQPAGNLDELLDRNEWEASEILWALDRIPRSLWEFEDVGRVHLSLSGTLLETLADPRFQQRAYGVVDCGSLLWHLQNTRTIDVLGSAYYHPVLPLIPPHDREEQIARWLGLGRHLFWRDRFRGFWPPELGFCMDLIPTLAGQGYEWVIVDSEHVRPLSPMSWEELRYRPHRARVGDAEMIVVVRDRDLSNAQESGMEAGWFIEEVRARTRHCDFPPLVTTATDGDNGGWFRNTTARRELLEQLLRGPRRPRARGPVGRHPTRLHQRLPGPARRPRLGHGRAGRVEHGRPPRNGLRAMDRLERPA